MGLAAERCKMRGVRDFASPRQPNRAERGETDIHPKSLVPVRTWPPSRRHPRDLACGSLFGREFRVVRARGRRQSRQQLPEIAMTKRRPTLEQQRTALQLGTLAAPYRFRVIADAEGFPIIPGRYGRIEWYCDGLNCWSCPLPRQVALAVYSDRPRLFQKLRAIPGVLRHQSGDAEMRAVLAVELLEQVTTVIRAKRWGGAGLGRPENFALSPGQVATSRRSKLLPAEDQGWRRHPSDPGGNRHDIDRPDAAADSSGAHAGLRAEPLPTLR